MKTVGIRDLKNRLSFYLKQVRRGERLIVADRNISFATIVPLGKETDMKLLSLVEGGFAAWKGSKPKGALQPYRIGGCPVSELILKERR